MYFSVASFEDVCLSVPCHMVPGIVLLRGAALTSPMSCAATCHDLLSIDASWPHGLV